MLTRSGEGWWIVAGPDKLGSDQVGSGCTKFDQVGAGCVGLDCFQHGPGWNWVGVSWDRCKYRIGLKNSS